MAVERFVSGAYRLLLDGDEAGEAAHQLVLQRHRQDQIAHFVLTSTLVQTVHGGFDLASCPDSGNAIALLRLGDLQVLLPQLRLTAVQGHFFWQLVQFHGDQQWLVRVQVGQLLRPDFGIDAFRQFQLQVGQYR